MIWRVVKQLSINEAQDRIRRFEEKYGSISLLHDRFIKGRMPSGQLQDYVEWSGMDHAIRAYQEGEDFEYFSDEELDFSFEEFALLTPKRIELLDFLSLGQADSINELAENIGRDVKNVWGDLQVLESLGFIRFEKRGRGLVPERIVYEISFVLE